MHKTSRPARRVGLLLRIPGFATQYIVHQQGSTCTWTLVGRRYPRSSVTARTSSGASPSASKPPAILNAAGATERVHESREREHSTCSTAHQHPAAAGFLDRAARTPGNPPIAPHPTPRRHQDHTPSPRSPPSLPEKSLEIGMQSSCQERNTAATAAGKLARSSAGVMLMILSAVRVGKGTGALRTNAAVRTRWPSSRPALVVHSTVHSSRSLQQDAAVGARPIEFRPEESTEDAPTSFFERMGSPRYIAAPMVEQSEAGEWLNVVLLLYHTFVHTRSRLLLLYLASA